MNIIKNYFAIMVVGILLFGCGPTTHKAVNLPNTPDAYMNRLIAHLQSDEVLNSVRSGAKKSGKKFADYMYKTGQSICDGMKRGDSIKSILDRSLYLFWGVELSNAMYNAANEVICPELNRPLLIQPKVKRTEIKRKEKPRRALNGRPYMIVTLAEKNGCETSGAVTSITKPDGLEVYTIQCGEKEMKFECEFKIYSLKFDGSPEDKAARLKPIKEPSCWRI